MFPGREWGPSYLSFLVSKFLVSYEAFKIDRDKICEDHSRYWRVRPWQGQSNKRIACRVDMLLERGAKSFVLKILEKNCKIIKSPAICPIKKGMSVNCLALTSIVFKTQCLDRFLSLGKSRQQYWFGLLLWRSGLCFGAWWQWYVHLVFPLQCFLLSQKLRNCSGN